jgi:2-beta-glucuronyltransferase
MKKVILITGHYWHSKRKAGFHWLADAFWQLGWEVTFFTVAISYLSVLKKDYRLRYPIFQEANQLIEVEPNFYSYVYFTPWHPANLRLNFFNWLSEGLFNQYDHFTNSTINREIKRTDLFIFESTPGILLFDYFHAVNCQAKYIYRVSDDLRFLKNHPIVLKKEAELTSQFDLISVPSQFLYEKFKHHTNCYLQFHGIPKALFNFHLNSPYQAQGEINAIFVGNSYLDYHFIQIASQLFPKWYFHIIGDFLDLPPYRNIIQYGEMPFPETVPYLVHADLGLQTLFKSYSPGIESFTDSLKVIQYTYCQLPIVAPIYIHSSRENFCYYHPHDPKSIEEALLKASHYPRDQINTQGIYSWQELALDLLNKVT